MSGKNMLIPFVVGAFTLLLAAVLVYALGALQGRTWRANEAAALSCIMRETTSAERQVFDDLPREWRNRFYLTSKSCSSIRAALDALAKVPRDQRAGVLADHESFDGLDDWASRTVN